jgi:hypothetical protein
MSHRVTTARRPQRQAVVRAGSGRRQPYCPILLPRRPGRAVASLKEEEQSRGNSVIEGNYEHFKGITALRKKNNLGVIRSLKVIMNMLRVC